MEIKACVDCKHYKKFSSGWCYHPSLKRKYEYINLETGETERGTTECEAVFNMRHTGKCDAHAELFEPKPPQPPKITIWDRLKNIFKKGE